MGRVIGFEISCQDPEKAAHFYREVFGWEIGEPMWDYRSVSTGKEDGKGELKGGISKGPGDYPHGTRILIEVDSIEETMATAKDHGAQVVREKMAFENFYLAYLVDPTGVGFGIREKK
ncbi:VOC family protein [Alteribacter keqinensis]|uniref:VOC family protein n=1 Tax=Alteribacter keqinensis TaxID=2483800 RepID=A0A3M7TP16_9BACI|nr:VOC family protein [Alteribacter keqinensis]RNA66994.1 VOC family protein [Alteribacter keqinensis]